MLLSVVDGAGQKRSVPQAFRRQQLETMRTIRLRGARTNNLCALDLDIEPGTLLVVAGPSGAGKSSLAFGTLYAEGQRRYVESFSAYARQFLERLMRPPVTELDPVPAAIAVDRQSPVKSSRSTVGTMTEISEYAKELWAMSASLHCPDCGERVEPDTPDSVVDALLTEAIDRDIKRGASQHAGVVTYPLTVHSPEHFLTLRESLLHDGYRRILHGSQVLDLDHVPPSKVLGGPQKQRREPQNGGTTMQVVADRVSLDARERSRLFEAVEVCFERGGGRVQVWLPDGETLGFSRELNCNKCQRGFVRPSLGMFSFNNPLGACTTCRGFGRTIEVDWEKVIPDPSKSIAGGAIRAWAGKAASWERRRLARHCREHGIPLDIPFQQLSEAQKTSIVEGDGGRSWRGWPGLRGWFRWLETKSYKMHVRVFLARYRKYETCGDCQGARLRPEALWWKIDGVSLADFYALPANRALEFAEARAKRAVEEHDPAVGLLLAECREKLSALCQVGLGYLTLDRAMRSLSGGELQRVALVSALGASLSGAMFVLDEPTMGLHPSDVQRLLSVVQRLTTGGNVAVVVEHDPVVLKGADRVVELGPGAGASGGRIVFDGPPAALRKAKTATAKSLRRRTQIEHTRREAQGWLKLDGARGHNLKDLQLRLPLGTLTSVTGVSGSGKSSLVLLTLLPAVARALGDVAQRPLSFDALHGHDRVSETVGIDQSPMGRTSRGNPATYLGCWELIRKRLAATDLARERKYKAGMFSFNVAGGRCEACRGEGAETVEMQFLADVTFTCPECGGRRFVGPVLDVSLHGKNAAELLDLTVDQAAEIFRDDEPVLAKLRPLSEVGAGYLRLGQALNTLSGGEAQRLKLAAGISRVKHHALIVLDEPTAGLHAQDVEPLVRCLHNLVDADNTVVVVEHDMMLAAASDHVIDLGPGAGEHGGRIVAQGTPEQVATATATQTAPFLARALGLAGSGKGRRATNRAASAKRRASALSVSSHIRVTGAREHNLRGVDLRLPLQQLAVVSGPSGSGKSSLAFDTIYAEGQRRYLESLSPYARQYLPQLPRPAVDRVVGVPPSISLQQRVSRGAKNATVATVTEVAHYMRLLFARAGLLHCPECRQPIAPRQPAALAADIRRRFSRASVRVLSPIVRGKKGAHRELLGRMHADGYREALIDGEPQTIEPGMKLARYEEHDIEILLDTLRADSQRLDDLLGRALKLGDGVVRIQGPSGELLLSTKRACPSCGRGFPELDPRLFSFNTRQGACAQCEGSGVVEVQVGRGRRKTSQVRMCPLCQGRRLQGLALSVTVAGHDFVELMALSVQEALHTFGKLELAGRERAIAEPIVGEIISRLGFLARVSLGYLNLDRAAWTLSSGEMQRVRLAAQLGSGLTGLLYVLDEPTIGLHPRDTKRVLDALRELVQRGCSVLIAEHDADTIRAADFLIDMGPGGGQNGGQLLAHGPPEKVLASASSITGRSLARPAVVPEQRRDTRRAPKLWLSGAAEHNLRGLHVKIPLSRLVAVTGVSGSGKSTLVREVLLRATRKALGLATEEPGAYASIKGTNALRRAVEIDQNPIGRTPRSVPATYVGVWDEIRKLFAATPAARTRGYTASRFSFNVEAGRCPACEGQGVITAEMSFLPQVLATCQACHGLRFNAETLDVRLHDRSAGQMLQMHIDQARDVLAAVPKVRRPLDLLCQLGLGYLTLGQPSNTLSGGEAQRLKLVSELATVNSGPTLYVMDEPTTGLHREDVYRLMAVLSELVERGDTVLVIEHHPDVIIAADWVIDLGPEGGVDGGTIVAQGTPEQIMACPQSHTGAALRRLVG